MADKLEIYTKSTKAWFKDPEDGYVVASLVERIVDEKNVILKFKVDATSAVCQAEFSSKFLANLLSICHSLPFLLLGGYL